MSDKEALKLSQCLGLGRGNSGCKVYIKWAEAGCLIKEIVVERVCDEHNRHLSRSK